MVNRYSREGIHSSSSFFLMLLPRWTDAACTHAGNPNSVRCFLRSSLTIPGTRIEVLPFFSLLSSFPFHFFIPFPRMNEGRERERDGCARGPLSDKGITHFANFFIANFSPWGPSLPLSFHISWSCGGHFQVSGAAARVRSKEGHAGGG